MAPAMLGGVHAAMAGGDADMSVACETTEGMSPRTPRAPPGLRSTPIPPVAPPMASSVALARTQQQTDSTDWRSTITPDERMEVCRAIREAYVRTATSTEELLQLVMALEEEFIFLLSPSRLDYIKAAVQFGHRLADRKRAVDQQEQQRHEDTRNTTHRQQHATGFVTSSADRDVETMRPSSTHTMPMASFTATTVQLGNAPSMPMEAEVGLFDAPPPPPLSLQISGHPYFHGSGVFGQSGLGSGEGPAMGSTSAEAEPVAEVRDEEVSDVDVVTTAPSSEAVEMAWGVSRVGNKNRFQSTSW